VTITPGKAARRVLVVEDDHVIADAVRRRLIAEGYHAEAVHDGREAVTMALDADGRVRYDLIVLDVMLPGLDGLEVCRRIQSRDPVPVLMLTARAEEADRLIGLAVGADDYLTKPFSPRELVARVAALLRRVERAAALAAAAPSAGDVIEAGGLRVEVATRRVTVGGEEVRLTRTEFDLLLALAKRRGEVVGRDWLLTEVWQWPDALKTTHGSAGRTIDSHVKALRRKVGAERIRTVHGVGYALEDQP
jgi:DNA-binding response OmpR family regulator